jgi:hypothetical protein
MAVPREDLPEDIDALRAALLTERARTARVEAELAVARAKASDNAAPCCMGRRCGHTEPDPCSGSCDADVLWASQLQHSVQHVGRNSHLARLSPVGLRTEPITDDALPARDIALHQGTPVVP